MLYKKNDFDQEVDIIVIGSGFGGLTVAALLSKAGKRVLVLEQHDRPGGYAHGFKRKKYTFDSGVHLISGCGTTGVRGGQIIRKILQAIDMYENIDFIEVNPFAYISTPNYSVNLPTSLEGTIQILSELFPQEKQGIHDLLVLCLQLAEQVAQVDDVVSVGGVGAIHSQLGLLSQYRYSTLANVWSEYIHSPDLQCLFAGLWPYLGLPPDKVSFVYWASMLMGYMTDGAFYCKGGFQKLADGLVTGLEQAGGSISYKQRVKKIQVEDNQVQGVLLTSDKFIRSKIVVANADMLQTVYELVGRDYFPKRYLARLQRLEVSCSIFVVYIATDLPLVDSKAHHEAFYYEHLDHETNYSEIGKEDISWLSITIPTLVDSTLAPKGQHLIVLTALAKFGEAEEWRQAKAILMQKMLDFADKKIANLKSHILFIEAGSPATLHRYTSNHQGAAYGWAMTPKQTGTYRVANQSPIGGLYFSGHWAAPGGGVYGVSYSGVRTAQQILGLATQGELWALCTSLTS